jgi:hypothetical protein
MSRKQPSPPVNQDGMFCAPGVHGAQGTCFDREGLVRIIDKYNRTYPNRKITYRTNTPNHKLWSLIRDGLANVCGDQEWCWLDQNFLKGDEHVQKYYRPPKPETQKKWLSTSDIDGVLKQYEKIYLDFAFMGTVPLDFDVVIEEYKNIDMCSMYLGGGSKSNGKRIFRYGFVFNLDPHDQRGSHWVSMFMNLNDQFIGFFDSYGHQPPKQIESLIRRLKSQAKKCLGVDLVYKCNTIQHQHKDTECGVYSLYFIYQCLKGQSFESITETIILDDAVNKFRDFFFRPTIHYKGR